MSGQPRVLIGATLAPYILSKPEAATAWLRALEDGAAEGVSYAVYAALELDERGVDPYEASGLLDRLRAADAFIAIYRGTDTGVITTENRVERIVKGLNTVRDAGLLFVFTHIWYNHADTYAPRGALAKLLEVDWPIVGAHVPAYALDGPKASRLNGWHALPEAGDIRVHMSPGASLLVRNDLGRQIPWRFDPIAGLTDDPAYHHDALALGVPTLVRHDVVCRHYPECLTPMETRFTEESRLWTPAPPVS